MLPRSLSSNLSRSLIRRSITTSPHLITPVPSTTTNPNPIITESATIPSPPSNPTTTTTNPTPIETHFGFKNVPEDQKEDMGAFLILIPLTVQVSTKTARLFKQFAVYSHPLLPPTTS